MLACTAARQIINSRLSEEEQDPKRYNLLTAKKYDYIGAARTKRTHIDACNGNWAIYPEEEQDPKWYNYLAAKKHGYIGAARIKRTHVGGEEAGQACRPNHSSGDGVQYGNRIGGRQCALDAAVQSGHHGYRRVVGVVSRQVADRG